MECPTCHQTIKKARKSVPRNFRRKAVVSRQGSITEPAQDLINQIVKEKDTVHWVILADMINTLQTMAQLSERRLAGLLSISKSEIHRLLLLSDLPANMKIAATDYNTEKYVLLEWQEIKNPQVKNDIRWSIESGVIRLRKQFQIALKRAGVC